MNSKMIAPAQPVETLLSKCQIPIIDLAHIGTQTCPMKSVVRRVGGELHKALSEKGLALLVNHGIGDEKLKAAYGCLDDFCALPEDVQSRFLRRPSTNHGYIRPGMEKFDGKTMEYRHAFNITTLKESELPEEDLIPEFSKKVGTLAEDFTNLSSLLLKALAVTLGLSPTYFLERHTNMMSGKNNNQSTLRLLYYPPVPPEDEVEGCISSQDSTFTRCGAHCDYGTFTLLAQDSEGGLEVKLPCSGAWQTVGHLPGALLVNTGEVLASWTQDKYPALSHRVIVPKTTYAQARGRHSIAFFCHPDDSSMMESIHLPQNSAANSSATTNSATCNGHHRTNSLHNRMVNAYHHIQKRFRETYA